MVFDAKCIGCHAGNTPSGNLDLSADNSYGNIFQQSATSSDLLLIRAGSRSESYLWHKVAAWNDDSITLSGGAPMPLGEALSEEEL
ncbi:MAG: hypothetical protein ABGY42_15980, partial [bacterium]